MGNCTIDNCCPKKKSLVKVKRCEVTYQEGKSSINLNCDNNASETNSNITKKKLENLIKNIGKKVSSKQKIESINIDFGTNDMDSPLICNYNVDLEKKGNNLDFIQLTTKEKETKNTEVKIGSDEFVEKSQSQEKPISFTDSKEEIFTKMNIFIPKHSIEILNKIKTIIDLFTSNNKKNDFFIISKEILNSDYNDLKPKNTYYSLIKKNSNSSCYNNVFSTIICFDDSLLLVINDYLKSKYHNNNLNSSKEFTPDKKGLRSEIIFKDNSEIKNIQNNYQEKAFIDCLNNDQLISNNFSKFNVPESYYIMKDYEFKNKFNSSNISQNIENKENFNDFNCSNIKDNNKNSNQKNSKKMVKKDDEEMYYKYKDSNNSIKMNVKSIPLKENELYNNNMFISHNSKHYISENIPISSIKINSLKEERCSLEKDNNINIKKFNDENSNSMMTKEFDIENSNNCVKVPNLIKDYFSKENDSSLSKPSFNIPYLNNDFSNDKDKITLFDQLSENENKGNQLKIKNCLQESNSILEIINYKNNHENSIIDFKEYVIKRDLKIKSKTNGKRLIKIIDSNNTNYDISYSNEGREIYNSKNSNTNYISTNIHNNLEDSLIIYIVRKCKELNMTSNLNLSLKIRIQNDEPFFYYKITRKDINELISNNLFENLKFLNINEISNKISNKLEVDNIEHINNFIISLISIEEKVNCSLLISNIELELFYQIEIKSKSQEFSDLSLNLTSISTAKVIPLIINSIYKSLSENNQANLDSLINSNIRDNENYNQFKIFERNKNILYNYEEFINYHVFVAYMERIFDSSFIYGKLKKDDKLGISLKLIDWEIREISTMFVIPFNLSLSNISVGISEKSNITDFNITHLNLNEIKVLWNFDSFKNNHYEHISKYVIDEFNKTFFDGRILNPNFFLKNKVIKNIISKEKFDTYYETFSIDDKSNLNEYFDLNVLIEDITLKIINLICMKKISFSHIDFQTTFNVKITITKNICVKNELYSSIKNFSSSIEID